MIGIGLDEHETKWDCGTMTFDSLWRFLTDGGNPWVIVGYAGQLLFSLRFIVQWIASERRRRSYIPVAFWFFSIGGGMTLFAYAVQLGDPVFILGQGAGIVIYSRNLYFIWRERRETASETVRPR